MDLTLAADNGLFNYRVGAIIILDNKVLMVKDPNEYYYSVGGRVHFGESSEAAILREVEEEIGISLEIDHLAFIHENFFAARFADNQPFHEIAFFYVMKSSYQLQNLSPNDSFVWLPMEKLSQLKIYPHFFQTELPYLGKTCKHFLTQGEQTSLCL